MNGAPVLTYEVVAANRETVRADIPIYVVYDPVLNTPSPGTATVRVTHGPVSRTQAASATTPHGEQRLLRRERLLSRCAGTASEYSLLFLRDRSCAVGADFRPADRRTVAPDLDREGDLDSGRLVVRR